MYERIPTTTYDDNIPKIGTTRNERENRISKKKKNTEKDNHFRMIDRIEQVTRTFGYGSKNDTSHITDIEYVAKDG